MQTNLISIRRIVVFTLFALCIFSIETAAQMLKPLTVDAPTAANTSLAVNSFTNPIIKLPAANCAVDNIRAERFVSEVNQTERVRLCEAIGKITNQLNANRWSPALFAELQNIWQAFSSEPVTLRLMPKNLPAKVLAMAEPFPDKTIATRFAAAVYIRPEKSDDAAFFQILMHELRHVYDFHETWKNQTAIQSLELERRAYSLMGKLTQETPKVENFSGVPKFWKESWRGLSDAEIAAKRDAAVQKYIGGKKMYQDLANDPNRRQLDFSYLNPTQRNNRQNIAGGKTKGGVPLPAHETLPSTVGLIPQNIQDTTFNLEKPTNPRDEKEILRVALSNEKKLYYGMSNFVYDQKLAFQCLKEGKVSASFAENTTVARTEDGDALLQLKNAPSALPCVLNYADLKTDFTNTFWASPALEKMPIYFSGFREVEGKTLAQYTVLQPDEKLFAKLAEEFPHIRPFRVIVGTIFVSPEDGQIVKFAGTSFPEETVTGDYARQARCTYWVKAVRQKLNIEDGLWVTVHVGTVAVANVQGKIHPFNYTVNFENYRQGATDVRVLDDNAVAVSQQDSIENVSER